MWVKSLINKFIKIKKMKKLFLVLGVTLLLTSCDNSTTDNATTETTSSEEVVATVDSIMVVDVVDCDTLVETITE